MVDTIIFKRRSRNLALLSTLLLVGSLVTILLLIILHTPIPPYPEGGGGQGNGIELNLGFSDEGLGNNPQEIAMDKDAAQPAPQAAEQEDKLLTQDEEEAPVINETVVKDKKIKKDIKKTPVEKPKKEVKKQTETPRPVVNTNALYRPKTNQPSADGDKGKSGDQGNPNGSLAAKAFGGKGGQGGAGGGTGGGVGTGTGPGVGSGISFNLAGRSNVGAFPRPEYKQQVEGVVVVEVTVDKEGKVTQAVAGAKGTTTLDESLRQAAEQAALKTRFDKKPDAPAFQKGTITYRFRLQ
jgi:TonB family C-terminal domain